MNTKHSRTKIDVIFADGYRLQISNRANKEKVTISELVRKFIRTGLGL